MVIKLSTEVCAPFESKFTFAPTGVSLPLKTLPKPMQPMQAEKIVLMFKRTFFSTNKYKVRSHSMTSCHQT